MEISRDSTPVPVKTEVQTFPLEKANVALEDLRRGNIQGVAVLTMTRSHLTA